MSSAILKHEKAQSIDAPALVIRLRRREVARVILGSRVTRVEFSIPTPASQQLLLVIRYLSGLAEQNNSKLSIKEDDYGRVEHIDIAPPLPRINASEITRKILTAISRAPGGDGV